MAPRVCKLYLLMIYTFISNLVSLLLIMPKIGAFIQGDKPRDGQTVDELGSIKSACAAVQE